ncbi:MAG: YbhB/YbcL family Raf kinase inhibitor-like protein [Acidobacteria bacterium]|nr:YbhB/YbcL family Raf kinase inhibitor-like protein [Acidobacteriota bacterium]
MTHARWMVMVTAPILAVAALTAQAPAQAPAGPPLTLTVMGFADGTDIPVRFSQAGPGAEPGGGTSPAIAWTNVPAGTQSFVLHMRDLDVARNRTTEDQPHWLVWNIPASVTSLPEGLPRGSTLPNGAYQISATGPLYRGPGARGAGPKHHYMFEIYALDIPLTMAPAADAFQTRTQVFQAMQGHILGKAVYGGLFRRPE